MLWSFRNDKEHNKIIIKVTYALYPKYSEIIKSLCVRNKLKFKLFFTTVSEFILSLIHKSFRQVLRTGSNEWLKRCDSIIISSQIGLISQIIKQSWVNVHFNFSQSYHVTSEEFEYRAWVIWTTLMSFCSFCTLKPPVLIQCAWKTATLLYQNAFFCVP